MPSSRADRTSRHAEEPDPFGFRAIRDELSTVFSDMGTTSQSVLALRSRLDAAMTDAEEEIARRTHRIQELEDDKEQLQARVKELLLEIKNLRARGHQSTNEPNIDLQKQLRDSQAERDELSKQLRRAWKYSNDLYTHMRSNPSMASTSPRSRYTAPPSGSPKTAGRQGGTAGPSRAQRDPPLASMDLNGQGGPRRQSSRAARVETVASDDDGEAAPDNDDASEKTVEGPRDQYASYSFDLGSPPPGEQLDPNYEFKITGIPNAAAMWSDAMTFEKLRVAMELEPDSAIVKDIEELDTRREKREFHLCFLKNTVFVLDPIFIEAPEGTFMVTWMTRERCEQTHVEHWDGDDPDPEYHTIIRLKEQDVSIYIYIGKLRWSHVELPPQWPKYIKNIKIPLANALHQRWNTELTPKEISGLIEAGKFQQFCIRLSSSEAMEQRSRKFAQKKLPGIAMNA